MSRSESPGLSVGQYFLHESGMKAMSAFERDQMAPKGITDEGNVPEEVEDLVPNELVRVAERTAENTLLPHYHRVRQITALRQSPAPHCLNIL